MAGPSKQQFLSEIHNVLKERYPIESGPPPKLTVLEAVIFGICREGTTRDQANQALSRFKLNFFDMNEVRVSAIAEIQECLAGIPQPEERAQRIRKFLRQLFNHIIENSEKIRLEHVLDPLIKKPLKDALKVLEQFEALTSDYVSATVVQLALGGHAIPLDNETRRALEQLGVADSGMDAQALRGLLERAVPKQRAVEFITLIEELAHETRVDAKSNGRASDALHQVIVKVNERLNPGAVVEFKAAKPSPPDANDEGAATGKAASSAKASASRSKPSATAPAPLPAAAEPSKAAKPRSPRPK